MKLNWVWILMMGIWILFTAHMFAYHAHGAEATVRTVTAYNVGDTAQTDDTPCTDASNSNICLAVDRGELRCAANFVPLGTQLHIEKVGTCTVTDRMNRRYKNRVDLAFPKHKKAEALRFGKQKLHVEVLL